MSCFIDKLTTLQEEKVKRFTKKLVPNIEANKIMGIRIPDLRSLARRLSKEASCEVSHFLKDLPHFYLEENLLHAFLIELILEESDLLSQLEHFLPYIDNWIVSDTLMPKLFKKNPQILLPHLSLWLASTHTYTVRFAIGLLLKFFLGNMFHPKYLETVANIKTEEYYINMMIAWFFAEALFKQTNATFPFIKEKRLNTWVHNKAIQKARESKRIDDALKAELTKLKIQ